jgi:hypothetical protein
LAGIGWLDLFRTIFASAIYWRFWLARFAGLWRRDFVGDEVVAAPSCDGIGRAGEDGGRRSVLEPHRSFSSSGLSSRRI